MWFIGFVSGQIQSKFRWWGRDAEILGSKNFKLHSSFEDVQAFTSKKPQLQRLQSEACSANLHLGWCLHLASVPKSSIRRTKKSAFDEPAKSASDVMKLGRKDLPQTQEPLVKDARLKDDEEDEDTKNDKSESLGLGDGGDEETGHTEETIEDVNEDTKDNEDNNEDGSIEGETEESKTKRMKGAVTVQERRTTKEMMHRVLWNSRTMMVIRTSLIPTMRLRKLRKAIKMTSGEIDCSWIASYIDLVYWLCVVYNNTF